MKYKSRKKELVYMFIIILIAFSAFFVSYYIGKKEIFLDKNINVKQVNADSKRNNNIEDFISNIKDEKVLEKVDIDSKITSILVRNNLNEYSTYYFNYSSGEQLGLKDIVKDENNFYEKVKELLYLKYPNFIADVISKFDKRNVLYFKDNEVIIYFYDYVIEPAVNEALSLTVNYNEIHKMLNFTVKLDKEYKNENGFDINANKKLIAITFDDGPSNLTEELVDILNENKVHSTFFFVGNKLAGKKSAVLKTFNSGNEIGYHSYAHANFKRQEIEKVTKEFDKSNEILKNIIGEEIKLTRPPYGSINEEVKNALPTSFILWDIDTNDWRYKDLDYLVNHVLENAEDGDIVLFHDTYKTSIEAVRKLLPELYAKGFQAVTVTDLANAKGVTLENNKIYRSIY